MEKYKISWFQTTNQPSFEVKQSSQQIHPFAK
jgi:hypothetical protein